MASTTSRYLTCQATCVCFYVADGRDDQRFKVRVITREAAVERGQHMHN